MLAAEFTLASVRVPERVARARHTFASREGEPVFEVSLVGFLERLEHLNEFVDCAAIARIRRADVFVVAVLLAGAAAAVGLSRRAIRLCHEGDARLGARAFQRNLMHARREPRVHDRAATELAVA